MDKQKPDRRRKTIVFELEDVESRLLGMTCQEVRVFFGRDADERNGNEWVFVLGSYFFGMYRKTLHLYFRDGRVDDYYL